MNILNKVNLTLLLKAKGKKPLLNYMKLCGFCSVKPEKAKNLTEAKKMNELKRKDNSSKHVSFYNKNDESDDPYDKAYFDRHIVILFTSPLVINSCLFFFNNLVFDMSSFISASFLYRYCFYSNFILQGYILGDKTVTFSEEFATLPIDDQEKAWDDFRKYTLFIFPFLLIMAFSQYIIYKKSFSYKDCALIILLNTLNSVKVLDRKEALFKLFNRRHFKLSLLSSVLFIFIYLVKNEANLEYDNDYPGVKDMKILDDIITMDNAKLAEENELFTQLIKRSKL